ncbi:hypothetical protein Tco_0250664, partial [Tanacetum coccineum]
EFTSEPIVIKPVIENSKAKASEAKPKAVRKNNGALIIKDWVSKTKEEDVPQAKIEKKTVKPSFAKIEFLKPKGKTTRKTAKQVEQLRQNTHTPRGNQRKWNNMMSQRLGINTAKPKAVVNAVKGNNFNDVKALGMRSKAYQRRDKDCLENKNTYEDKSNIFITHSLEMTLLVSSLIFQIHAHVLPYFSYKERSEVQDILAQQDHSNQYHGLDQLKLQLLVLVSPAHIKIFL